MLSDAAKIRLINRKYQGNGIVGEKRRNGVWFSESVRRAHRIGKFIIFYEILEPITPFNEGDFWWKPQLFEVKRQQDSAERLMAHFDELERKAEQDNEDYWKDFGDRFDKRFSKNLQNFAMSDITKEPNVIE